MSDSEHVGRKRPDARAVQSFGTELHKGVKDRLTVSTDVKLRERFWRDVESWAKIHLFGTDWQADERILECIKVNALGGTRDSSLLTTRVPATLASVQFRT